MYSLALQRGVGGEIPEAIRLEFKGFSLSRDEARRPQGTQDKQGPDGAHGHNLGTSQSCPSNCAPKKPQESRQGHLGMELKGSGRPEVLLVSYIRFVCESQFLLLKAVC